MDHETRTIEQVLAGNRQAFGRLIERYQRLVVHVVYRMVADSRDREELCQDVFIKVYRSLHTFRREAKLSTWIARIAYHTCLNHLERKQIPLLEDLQTSRETDYREEPVASDLLPDTRARRKEVETLVHRAIEGLPLFQRVVLAMYHLEGLSITEISDITNRPSGTIKSDLFRARKLLKNKLLQKYSVEDLSL